jgi:hypothetical protein
MVCLVSRAKVFIVQLMCGIVTKFATLVPICPAYGGDRKLGWQLKAMATIAVSGPDCGYV